MQELSETRQSQKQDNMVQLTTEQRVFVVTNFIRMQNVREVQDAFRLRFPDRNPPLRNTILDNVRKCQNTGTSLNRNNGKSGQRRTGRREELKHCRSKRAVGGKPTCEFSSESCRSYDINF